MKCFTKMFTKSPGPQTSQIKNYLLYCIVKHFLAFTLSFSSFISGMSLVSVVSSRLCNNVLDVSVNM